MYSFIPFALLVIINIFLLIDLSQKSRQITTIENTNISKHQISISVSVIVMTFLFIVFTCPSAIASQYYDILVLSFSGNVLLSAADCLSFTFHAFNLVILCASIKEFMRRWRKTFIHKQNSVSTHPTTSNVIIMY